MTATLSPELRTLLEAKLDTFEKLELVLALRAAAEPQGLPELAVNLQVGREALRRVAAEVVAVGIIKPVGEERLQLCPGEWEPLLDEAARCVSEQPRMLMQVFTKIAMEKIRGLSARTFADAFRFRKKDG